jgi:hypothetical protein
VPCGARETDPQELLSHTPLIPTAEAVEGSHGSKVVTATPVLQIDEMDQDHQHCSGPAAFEAEVYSPAPEDGEEERQIAAEEAMSRLARNPTTLTTHQFIELTAQEVLRTLPA